MVANSSSLLIRLVMAAALAGYGVNSKPYRLEYLPVIIAALDAEQTGLAAYPFVNATPSLASLSILGVFKLPSAAPPL